MQLSPVSAGGRLPAHSAEEDTMKEFPYGSPDITGSDWTSPSRHGSYLVSLGEKRYLINRVMDDLLYQVMIELDGAQMIQEEEHRFSIRFDAAKAEITILTDRAVPRQFATFNKCCEESEVFWRDYWENTGLIDFGETQDTRAHELERREILSFASSRCSMYHSKDFSSSLP